MGQGGQRDTAAATHSPFSLFDHLPGNGCKVSKSPADPAAFTLPSNSYSPSAGLRAQRMPSAPGGLRVPLLQSLSLIAPKPVTALSSCSRLSKQPPLVLLCHLCGKEGHFSCDERIPLEKSLVKGHTFVCFGKHHTALPLGRLSMS